MTFVKADEVSVKYDGAAVDDHSMDATQLGPALLAFGNLARITQETVDPLSGKQITAKVQAFNAGSFEIMFGLDSSILEQAINLFTGKPLTGAATAATLGGVILQAVKYVKKEAKEKKKVSRDQLISELGDELLAEHVYKLKNNREFREQTGKLVKPVTNTGIESMSLKNDNIPGKLTIDSQDAEAIESLAEEETILTRVESILVEVDTPDIGAPLSRMWRFKSEKYGTFRARMLDQDFATAVEAGRIYFAAGKRFEARVRIEDHLVDGVVEKTKFEVVSIQEEVERQTELEY